MNPFDEAFDINAPIQGLSSGEVQRRIYILSERVRYLYEVNMELKKEVDALKGARETQKRVAKA